MNQQIINEKVKHSQKIDVIKYVLMGLYHSLHNGCGVTKVQNPFRSENKMTEELHTHRFDLCSVQFSPVEHDSMDGITSPSSLDGGGEHIQEVLERKKTN